MNDAPRQIVLCMDGTSNTLTGWQRDTNVLRLFEHLAGREDVGQQLFYDPGVGSPDAIPATGPLDWFASKWRRLAGLAYGRGIYENIRAAYSFLMDHWQPGDEVYIFGFSRGAFSARCVAGMVNLFGILRPEHHALLQTLLRVYFAPVGGVAQLEVRQKSAKALLGLEREANTGRTREDIAAQVRAGFCSPEGREAWVHFVGVWDTVASVGVPGLSLRISSTATVSGKRMRNVRHALALDEHRHPFLPRLYTEDDFGEPAAQRPEAPAGEPPQSLRQRWFRGVHGDAGGGYAPQESGLSDEALGWMVEEARACGLRTDVPPDRHAETRVHDPVYTVSWWAMAGLAVRDTRGGEARLTPLAHASVTRAGVPSASVWDGPRSLVSMVFALAGLALGLVVHGSLLAGAGWQLMPVAGALAAGAAMARAQIEMLWTTPAGDWRALWAGVPQSGSLLRAFLADGLVIASYGFLLSRITGWAFTRRAGLRSVGQALAAWRWLGLALPCAVLGDCAEDIFTWLALQGQPPVHFWQALLLWIGSWGSLAKWAGLAGCAVLAAMGAVPRGSRSP